MVKVKPKLKRPGFKPPTEARTVRKTCPECDHQCPVALRECKCGYTFAKVKPLKPKPGKVKKCGKNKQCLAAKGIKASTSAEAGDATDKSGRRCRTKRMRPDFFNSLELEYASKAFRNRKQKEGEKELKRKKKRGRPKGTTGIPRRTKEEKRRDEEAKLAPVELGDMFAGFPPERMQDFSFILDEINFKMASTMFKPL